MRVFRLKDDPAISMGNCTSSTRAVAETESVHKQRNPSLVSNLGRTGHTAKSSSMRSNPSFRNSMGTNTFGERYYFSYVVLGKGGEATVYEGIDKLSSLKVAIKIVLKKGRIVAVVSPFVARFNCALRLCRN